jgi:hypothetical protein
MRGARAALSPRRRARGGARDRPGPAGDAARCRLTESARRPTDSLGLFHERSNNLRCHPPRRDAAASADELFARWRLRLQDRAGRSLEILRSSVGGFVPPELIVGIETADDAAVYRLNDTQALIATTDFFMPIVDDPFDFGRIAATNAISDVYAMGGRPIMALALVAMPIDRLTTAQIGEIIRGGESVCRQAGIPIAGGHTIDSVEPIYGLVVMGLVHPDKVRRNADAKAGDALVLGKPIGVGVLSAALKKGTLDAAGYRAPDRDDDAPQHARRRPRRPARRATRSPTSPASASPATRSSSRAAPGSA